MYKPNRYIIINYQIIILFNVWYFYFTNVFFGILTNQVFLITSKPINSNRKSQ